MRPQIERDLFKNACDRLELWARDTIMRCEIAELDEVVTISIIMACLSAELYRACDVLNIDPRKL